MSRPKTELQRLAELVARRANRLREAADHLARDLRDSVSEREIAGDVVDVGGALLDLRDAEDRFTGGCAEGIPERSDCCGAYVTLNVSAEDARPLQTMYHVCTRCRKACDTFETKETDQ